MAFRSSALGTHASGGGTSISATPAGVQAGDYLLAWLIIDGSGASPTSVPSGWSLQDTNDQTGPDGQTMLLYSKAPASGSDSFSWGITSGEGAILFTAAWSGRNTGAAPTIAKAQNTSSNASPITVNATGVTAASGDDIAVVFQVDQTAGTATWTFSQPTNYTERHDDSTVDWISGALDTRDNVSAGATGTISSTATRTAGSGNGGWGTFVVALAQAAAGGVVVNPLTGIGGAAAQPLAS